MPPRPMPASSGSMGHTPQTLQPSAKPSRKSKRASRFRKQSQPLESKVQSSYGPRSICTFDVANLIPELLDQIFGELERAHVQARQIRDDYLAIQTTRDGDNDTVLKDGIKSTSCAKSPFRFLVRVCKKWKPVAERRLYRSITVGRLTPSRSTANLLLRTLKEAPYLAGLVRELRMLDRSQNASPDLHLTHAGIISACTQLTHLTLLGFATSKKVLSKLHCSISRLTSLHSLVLVQHVHWSGFNGSHFGLCSAMDLLHWISHWPDIQHVVVYTNAKLPPLLENGRSTQKWSHPGTVAKYRQQVVKTCARQYTFGDRPSSFPHLRTFSYLQPTQATPEVALQELQAAAPSLSTVRVGLASEFTHIHRDSLITWAPALRSLSLEHSSQYKFDPQIEDVLLQLPCLELLHATSIVVPPEMLHHLSALKNLYYSVEDSEHLEALLEVIPDQLPSLRTCSLVRVPSDGFSLERLSMLEHLDDMCKDQGVKFDCVVDWQTIMNAIEAEEEEEPDEDWELDYDEDDGFWDAEEDFGDAFYYDDEFGQSHILFEDESGMLMRTSHYWGGDDHDDRDVANIVRQLRHSTFY